MTAALRKGWCPGALRPMMARDGLLVRLRITGGILPAQAAMALADAASRHGNGLFDLSARGNLQMRGVEEASLASLHADLRALGLLDEDAEGEAVRNVIASPLAGLASWIDIRPLVVALERAIVADALCRGLPGKFAVLVDDGSRPSLADVDADLRFDWRPDVALFSIGLGGVQAEAVRIGTCRADELVARACDLGMIAADLLGTHQARRLRHLVPVLGAPGLARAFGLDEPYHADTLCHPTMLARDWVGAGTTVRRMQLLGLALPFGRCDAAMLRAAADRAAGTTLGEIRLTPWRLLLIPGAGLGAPVPGFIVDPADPRLAVVACVGADGCARGSTPTHADAARLAVLLRTQDKGIALHVSGCAKGCAKPSSTPVTIVADDGRYGLVRDGRASDRPAHLGLRVAEIATALGADA